MPGWPVGKRQLRSELMVFGGAPKPGREEGLDVPAPARIHEASADALLLDDEKGRQALDAEALQQVAPLLAVDPDDVEGPMVVAPLENLREESVHTPAAAGEPRAEEDERGFRPMEAPISRRSGELGHGATVATPR